MKIHIGPSQILSRRIVRCLQGAASLASVAGLALSLQACGDDKKTTSNATPGSTTTGGTTTTVPTAGDTNTTAGTATGTGTTAAPTGTSMALTIDGAPAKDTSAAATNASLPPGTYAVLTSDASEVLITPYDYCAWAAKHTYEDSSSNVGTSPTSAVGIGVVLSISGTGSTPTPGMPYTINPQTTQSGQTYDNNVKVVGYNPTTTRTCTLTGRGATSGQVNWSTVSSTQISGSLDVKIGGWPGTTSTNVTELKGTFVAQKCPSVAPGPISYAADTTACTNPPTYN